MNDSRLKLMSWQEKLETMQFRKLWLLDDFDDRSKEREIMKNLDQLPGYEKYLELKAKTDRDRKSAPPEFKFMYEQPLLNKTQEQHLLRKYNFVKYKFKTLAEKTSPTFKDSTIEKAIKDLAKHYKLMGEIKNIIACANGRAVMTIAKKMKYTSLELSLADGYTGLTQAVVCD